MLFFRVYSFSCATTSLNRCPSHLCPPCLKPPWCTPFVSSLTSGFTSLPPLPGTTLMHGIRKLTHFGIRKLTRLHRPSNHAHPQYVK